MEALPPYTYLASEFTLSVGIVSADGGRKRTGASHGSHAGQ